MNGIYRLLDFLDRHSGLISAVGLVLAAIGLLLTLRYLRVYEREIKSQRSEQKRQDWERILRLLNEISSHYARAHLASEQHSPLVRRLGCVPPDIAADYEDASTSLLSYFRQLRLELLIMPNSPLMDLILRFVDRYHSNAEARASEQFGKDLRPITEWVSKEARKSFNESGGDHEPG